MGKSRIVQMELEGCEKLSKRHSKSSGFISLFRLLLNLLVPQNMLRVNL